MVFVVNGRGDLALADLKCWHAKGILLVMGDWGRRRRGAGARRQAEGGGLVVGAVKLCSFISSSELLRRVAARPNATPEDFPVISRKLLASNPC